MSVQLRLRGRNQEEIQAQERTQGTAKRIIHGRGKRLSQQSPTPAGLRKIRGQRHAETGGADRLGQTYRSPDELRREVPGLHNLRRSEENCVACIAETEARTPPQEHITGSTKAITLRHAVAFAA